MRLEGEAWSRMFETFEHSAFRLETLAQYRMPDEAEEFERFLSGEKPPADLHYPWLDTVAQNKAAGKVMQRVHVVTSPLSDYISYECEWGYAFNVRAGEDIRILDLAETANPGLPDQDFWMFDDKIVVQMLYKSDGTQIGRELLEDVDPAQYVKYKDLALQFSVPFLEYWARYNG